MQWIGSEPRIQELFLELKANDELLAPPFSRMWARETESPVRAPVRLSFAAVLALVLVAASALVLWSRRSESKQHASVLPDSEVPVVRSVVPEMISPSFAKEPRPRRRTNRFAGQRNSRLTQPALANQAVISKATAIALWQSPTMKLLESPAEDVMSSLPQLTDAAIGLQVFLPSEIGKENQR